MPTRTVTTKYFCFLQSPIKEQVLVISEKDGIGHFVIVEALNLPHAKAVMKEIVGYDIDDVEGFLSPPWTLMGDDEGTEYPNILKDIPVAATLSDSSYLWQDRICFGWDFYGDFKSFAGPNYKKA